MAHIVEIWEMHGAEGLVWRPACLSCGWVGTGGPRQAAETEGRLHEADESIQIVVARRGATDLRRSAERRARPHTD